MHTITSFFQYRFFVCIPYRNTSCILFPYINNIISVHNIVINYTTSLREDTLMIAYLHFVSWEVFYMSVFLRPEIRDLHTLLFSWSQNSEFVGHSCWHRTQYSVLLRVIPLLKIYIRKCIQFWLYLVILMNFGTLAPEFVWVACVSDHCPGCNKMNTSAFSGPGIYEWDVS